MRHSYGRLHALLGLEVNASYAQARHSYQQKVLQCHPDACATARDRGCSSFLDVQSAWEEYLRGTRPSRVDDTPLNKAATPRHHDRDHEMVLLGLSLQDAPPSTKADDVHSLRCAVTRTVSELCARADLPSVGVRRVEMANGRVEVHVQAEGPSHRNAVVGLCTSASSSFTEALRGALDETGWPTRACPVALRVCLPYTMRVAPPPAMQHSKGEDALALD